MSYWIVGENDGMTETARRLAICATHDQAAEYIGKLPLAATGIYYIDGPISNTVEIRAKDGK